MAPDILIITNRKQVQIEKNRKKNKSHEEIFYQMKVFLDQFQEVFFVNRPGAHN